MALDSTLEANPNLSKAQREGYPGLLSREELLEHALQAFDMPQFNFKNLTPKGIITPIDISQIPQQLGLETAYGLVTPIGNFLLYRPPLDCGCDCPPSEIIQRYRRQGQSYIH